MSVYPPNKLTELLQSREFLLADGAMGTSLFDQGLSNGNQFRAVERGAARKGAQCA